MRSRTHLKLIALLLAVVLTMLLLPGTGVVPAMATSSDDEVTQDDIDNLEDDLAAIQAQKNEVDRQLAAARNDLASAKKAVDLVMAKITLTESQIAKTQDLIQATQLRINELNKQITEMNTQIDMTQQEINRSEQAIQEYNAEIEQKETEITQLEQEEAAQTDTYYANVRWMEETGPVSYLAILFKSSTFSEMLDQATVIMDVMDYSQQVIAEMRLTQAKLGAAKDSLQMSLGQQNVLKEKLEVQKTDLEAQKSALDAETQVQEAENARLQQSQASLQNERAQREKEYQDALALMNQVAASESEFAAEAAKIAAAEQEAAKALKDAEEKYRNQLAALQNTGDWYWPVPGYTDLSSLFGGRIDPISGVPDNHTGTDIPCPIGTQVRAAQGGLVTFVSQNDSTSYGWYVMVAHGNGYVTLYAHLSQQAIVAEGQSVSKGQVIGYSGNTGRTTGPHLHFELRINGIRADVLSMYPGYIFKSPNGGTIMGG